VTKIGVSNLYMLACTIGEVKMSKLSTTDQAVADIGYRHGGYPMTRGRFIEVFKDSIDYDDFDQTKEKMRAALMQVHNDWSMELIADAAHICAVVAFKKPGGSHDPIPRP
jgi:hypothetical protein